MFTERLAVVTCCVHQRSAITSSQKTIVERDGEITIFLLAEIQWSTMRNVWLSGTNLLFSFQVNTFFFEVLKCILGNVGKKKAGKLPKQSGNLTFPSHFIMKSV